VNAGTKLLLAVAAIALGVSFQDNQGPSCARREETRITFNQRFIESRWRGQECVDATVLPTPADLSFDDPRSVLRLILNASPAEAVVYPSERYYYFAFPLGDRLVSGNLRFVDAERGIVHVGYFDVFDRAATRHATMDAANAVTVGCDVGSRRVSVAVDGVQRTFVLSTCWSDGANELALLPGEELVSGVLDESGMSFWLIHYAATKSLYYMLNERAPASDRLVGIRGTHGRYLVAEDSRFVFYADAATGRRILVAVAMESVRANNYFDGPFDQVPPDLSIRAVLESVYPYVTERGGIDEHGNFREIVDQRVAITPYQVYGTLDLLVPLLDAQLRLGEQVPERWTGMVYESKQDFHRQLAAHREALEELRDAPLTVHQTAQSSLWPPNHWGPQSRAWPSEHAGSLSRSWPANHEPTITLLQRAEQ
jgi:hypothetical protein